MDKTKTIYDLELHEEMVFEPKYGVWENERIWVLRVAGGWLYTPIRRQSVFVPFDNEFMKIKENGDKT